MADNEAKAIKTLAEADKKSKGGGGFMGLFGGSKADDACELYIKAANLFKMAKNWNEAGKCFVRSAEMTLQKGDAKHEAASNYADASTCYRKTQPQLAVDCLLKAVDIYTDMGRFTMAAKHHTTIAELYESDCVDLEKAMLHYEKAADYYKGEESKSSANKCLLKVAQYAAQVEQYQKAVEIYEDVGKSSAESNLLKYSAKDYFFRAALCQLCVDQLNAQHAIKRYEEIHPAFTDSRECKLLKQLLIALEEPNVDAFTDAIKEYDKISKLDSWFTTLLLRVKKSIAEDDMK